MRPLNVTTWRPFLVRSLSVLVASGAMAAELPVSQPQYTPAPSNQYHAAAASSPDQYFVVWTDERSRVPQAYATRIASDGAVLDPNGIRVSSGAVTGSPNVVWAGDSWFVVANACAEIELVRVAASGRVLDVQPRAFPVQAWCPGVSVAAGGGDVAVAYVTGYVTREMHALILDRDGDLVTDVLLSDGDAGNGIPAIAWDGSSFVAVWEGHAVRFDRHGARGPASSVQFGGSAVDTTHIAWNGEEFAVTRGGHLFRMATNLDAQLLAILPFADVQSLHWTGSHWAISGVVPFYENGHQSRNRVNIVLANRGGGLVEQRQMQSEAGSGPHPLNGAAVTTNGRNLLVAWHDPTEAPDVASREDDIYASLLALPDLTPGPRRLLSVAARSQHRPSTASSAWNRLTVWEETTGLYARRHARNGAADAAPLRLADAGTSSSVVFNGSHYIVASTEGREIVARRIPVDGELRVDRVARLTGGHGLRHVALASDGGVTLVAWSDYGIYAARVGPDGSWIDDAPLLVAPELVAAATHRVAISPTGSGEFLVVWGGSYPACYCSPPGLAEGRPLRAARVTSTGTLLDQPALDIAIPLPPYDSASDPASSLYDPLHSLFADHPSVTWNGTEWLVVWNRAFRDGAESVREEIRGRRVARNGTLLDGSARDPGLLIAPNAFAPTVAWTGSAYLLGWYEGSPSYRYPMERSLHLLRTASFDRAGGPLSSIRTLGEASELDLVSIAVADGFANISYARLGDDPRYGGVSRVFLELTGVQSRRRVVRR